MIPWPRSCLPLSLAQAAALAAALTLVSPLSAQPVASAQPAASAQAPARPTSSTSAPPMPADHPPASGSAAMPPARPAPAGSGAMPGLPPGHPDISAMGRMAPGGMMPARPPADRIAEDAELAPRSLMVQIVDGNDDPIPQAPFVLHTMSRSVAKGDAASQQAAVTDEQGRYLFEGLSADRSVTYRLTVERGPARFSSPPFGLSEQRGVRAVMHAFEPTRNPDEARVDVGAVVIIDLDGDAISVEHVLRLLVVGPKAWVAQGVTLPLPAEHAAFHAAEAMGRASVEPGNHGTAALRGTFPPGTTELSYGYRLPVASSDSVAFEAALPPRVSRARVVAAAAPGMTLRVDGLPPAQAARGPEGKRLLMTETQTTLGGRGLGSLRITLDGLPGPSPARWAALLLAVVAALAGGSMALGAHARRARSKALREDLREAQEVLLDEIVELERAHRRDEIDHAAYASARAALAESVARILRRQDESRRSSKKRK